jgi:hypothetical protein
MVCAHAFMECVISTANKRAQLASLETLLKTRAMLRTASSPPATAGPAPPSNPRALPPLLTTRRADRPNPFPPKTLNSPCRNRTWRPPRRSRTRAVAPHLTTNLKIQARSCDRVVAPFMSPTTAKAHRQSFPSGATHTLTTRTPLCLFAESPSSSLQKNTNPAHHNTSVANPSLHQAKDATPHAAPPSSSLQKHPASARPKRRTKSSVNPSPAALRMRLQQS